ncbi:YfjI family protein [Mesorhizobium sp. GR13]|uniref:YfjI family protein n=1 Tax=Mesorhizobium sp. GR13 TaxID=2562308 RepID=UPI0032B10D11
MSEIRIIPIAQFEAQHLSWPEPDLALLRPELPEPPALPLQDILSSRLAEWVSTAAESKSCPADYIFGGLLSVVASTIGNSRWAMPWHGWHEPPTIWTCLVGDPSSGKSPGLDATIVPLRQVEQRMREKAQAQVNEWNDKAETAKVIESVWRDAVKKAVASDDTPPPRPTGTDPGEQPFLPRLIIADATTERLAVILSRQPRGVLTCRDELSGWIMAMSRYSNGSDRPFWLEAFGGRGYSVERQSRDPITIRNLSVGVCGGIQPMRLNSLLVKADDDGLLARLLPIWPHPAPVMRPKVVPDEFLVENAISRLLTLEMPIDGDGNRRPWFVQFSDDAANLMDEFRKQVRVWEERSDGLLKSFVGKLPGVAARLSLVLAYLEWAVSDVAAEPKEISLEFFGKAAHLVDSYFLPMARRTYAPASVSDDQRAARCLIRLIKEQRWLKFTTRDAMRAERVRLGTVDIINPALKLLEDADIIRPSSKGTASQGGRSSRAYEVNPSIHGGQS